MSDTLAPMDPAQPYPELDDPNWRPPGRGIITAAGICGIASSLLWLWPTLLMLIALGSAGVSGVVMFAIFAIAALGAFGFVAAALSLRAKIVWLGILIGIQALFLFLGLAAFGLAAVFSLRFLMALATIIVTIIAIPQAAAIKRAGLDF